MSIFKACDVRGVVGQEWGADEARRIGRSLGRMIRTRGDASVCVGGDFRRSTPPLKQEFVEGLLEAGLTIYDVGQQPTPLVYFAARQLGCRSVAVVTASHNPARYNGIKFLVVQPLDKRRRAKGEPVIACDGTGQAGPGHVVMIVGAREASQALPERFVPVDWAITGIVDMVDLDDESHGYREWETPAA